MALCALVATPPITNASEGTKLSFKPVRTTSNALFFKVHNVDPAQITSARLRIEVAHRRLHQRLNRRFGRSSSAAKRRAHRRAHKRIRRHSKRRIGVDRIRTIAARGTRLRVSRPSWAKGGSVRVTAGARKKPDRQPKPKPEPASTPAPEPESTPESDSGTEPEPEPTSSAECPVDPATMTVPGCTVLRRDAGAQADPKPGLWGTIECQTESRHRHLTSGGDPGPAADGTSQGNQAYRAVTALDGDDFYGERCELGRNEHRNGENTGTQTSGTFALYREGERRITFFSQRYPDGFPVEVDAWQAVMQMKQTQPSTDDGSGVALELQLWGGRLRLHTFWKERWSTPAPVRGEWIRYAIDVVYSSDPARGSVQVYVDRNGDGDFLDSGEQSPRISTATLATQVGSSGGLTAGEAIPSHLRLGIYHNSSISCPAPGGCSVELDNVQVVSG